MMLAMRQDEIKIRISQKRLARLSGRTSREAWQQLQQVMDHPNFPALLAYLEGKPGTVLDADVAHGAQRFLVKPAPKERESGCPRLGDILYANGSGALAPETDWSTLVQLVAAGNERAFQELYGRLQGVVHALAARITDNKILAQEVTLDVFRDIWCWASTYDREEGSVIGWIMNHARAKATSRVRLSELPAPQPWTEPAWTEVGPGIFCKLLETDTELQRVSMLVRLAPGASYPPHRHAGIEELHLLEGELWIDDRKLHPGAYNRAEPGTADSRVWSETGCTCVLVTSLLDELH